MLTAALQTEVAPPITHRSMVRDLDLVDPTLILWRRPKRYALQSLLRYYERAEDAGDIDRPDIAQFLLGQEMSDLAEMDRVQPVQLVSEGDLLSSGRALDVVAIGSDAGEEDVADLVQLGAGGCQVAGLHLLCGRRFRSMDRLARAVAAGTGE